MDTKGIKFLFLFLVAGMLFFSCKKTDNFIAEDKIENGIHYYPVILNERFFDTVSKKNLNPVDTTFLPGDTLVFELDYFSQDSIDRIELWAGRSPKNLQKAQSTPYKPSFYSKLKGFDTLLISYTIPSGLDTTISTWTIQPRVVTSHTLDAFMNAAITLE